MTLRCLLWGFNQRNVAVSTVFAPVFSDGTRFVFFVSAPVSKGLEYSDIRALETVTLRHSSERLIEPDPSGLRPEGDPVNRRDPTC